MNSRQASIFAVIVSLAVSSCGQSTNGLNPPVSITSPTVGEICTQIKDGLVESPLAKIVAIGACEEKETLNGGKSLWIEMSDLTEVNPNISPEQLKLAMVSVSVSLASYGFRLSDVRPTDFEQLFFSFRDSKGSYFEIEPEDFPFVDSVEDLSQAEWDKFIEEKILELEPTIIVSANG